jgi:hypothetical protein
MALNSAIADAALIFVIILLAPLRTGTEPAGRIRKTEDYQNTEGTKSPDFPRIRVGTSRFVPLIVAECAFVLRRKAPCKQRKIWCCRTGLNCGPLPYQGSRWVVTL